MQVEIWSDVVCPWCYLGKRRFQRAVESLSVEVDVVHRSFQLDPSAPHDHAVPTSAYLAAKYGLTSERTEQMQAEMEARAAEDGLTYRLADQLVGNTFDAHRLLHFAKSKGRQDELIEAMYRVYFSESGSLFDADSLSSVATGVGLDADEVRAVLDGRQFTDEVEADIEQAREYGVGGVPFFVFDGRFAVSGAQPIEVLRHALERAGTS